MDREHFKFILRLINSVARTMTTMKQAQNARHCEGQVRVRRTNHQQVK